MHQSTIELLGHDIAYYDNKSSNQVVLFIHGNSLSSETYLHQLNDKSLNNYRLIAIDLPGHGNSSQANNPEETYSLPGFVSVLIEFVEKLNLQEVVFVGHSLGGHIILDAAHRLPLAKGFVVFGAPPLGLPAEMEKYFLPNPVFPLAYKKDLTNDEINMLAAAFVKKDTEVPEIVVNDIKRTHKDMRSYLGASLIPENLTNEVEVIEKLNKPVVIIIHGEGDQLVNGEYYEELNIPTLWQNKVQTVSDSGHCPQLENHKIFNRILYSFLNDIL